MLLLFTGGSGSGPAVASYPLDDDGTLAAAFGLGWLETDATAYNNADYTYTGAATGNSVVALPTAANAWTSQAIVVDTGTILACEAVINSVSAAQFANLGIAAAASSGGTPSGVAVINSIDNNGSPRWLVSGTGGTRVRSGATSGYRVGIELNGNDGTITMRSSDGSALCSTTFTPGTAFTFYLFATDAGNPAAGQTASITLVPVGADMQLGYTTGATDFNGDPCPQGYAIWNRYDAKAGSVVSSNNLVFSSGAASDLYTIRGNVTKTVGGSEKPEFEITITSDSSSNLLIGIGIAGTTLPVYAGETVNSWGYLDVNGQMYHSGAAAAFGATYTTGDVLTFSLAGTSLLVKKNGASQGTITLSNGQQIQPIGTIYIPTDSLTINGGQTPLLYPEPGYDGGWPA